MRVRETLPPMNIHEYQAAEILTRYGIPVNAGIVAQSPEEAEAAAAGFGRLVAVKAQVHSGGRGKAGGIKLAKTPADAKSAADAILGMDIRGHQVNKVLVAPGVNIARSLNFRPLSGRLLMRSEFTTPPSVAVSVCNSGDDDVTSTVCCTVPTCSEKSILAC